MKYAIVYSSQTGNTAMLAEAIRTELPVHDCLYFGAPDPKALEADRIYIGFWTDKGTCDEKTSIFLKALTTQQIFLFGTAGFGGDEEYFQGILAKVRQELAPEVTVVGQFMCQGKMPPEVRRRYASLDKELSPDIMLSNFEQALTHPDDGDLHNLVLAIQDLD